MDTIRPSSIELKNDQGQAYGSQANYQSIWYGGSHPAFVDANLFDTVASKVKSGALTIEDAASQVSGKAYRSGDGVNAVYGESAGGSDPFLIDAIRIAAGLGTTMKNAYTGAQVPTYSIGAGYKPEVEQKAIIEGKITPNSGGQAAPAPSAQAYTPAYKAILLPNGTEVNYDYAQPAIKAGADSGQYKTKSYAAVGTPPAGTPATPAPANSQAQAPAQTSNKNIYNTSTGQWGYQVPGGALQPGWEWKTPGSSTSAPTPAPTSPQAANPGTPASIAPKVQPPQVALQPGATGADVKALQDYLVSLGFMTPEQVATGPGIYGPKTTAAVQAFQQTFGVDNSTGPGFWGPRSIATATQLAAAQAAAPAAAGGAPGSTGAPGTTPGPGAAPGTPGGAPAAPAGSALASILTGAGVAASPTMSLTDMIKELSKAYGMDDITSAMKKIDDDYITDVANINDDPWISEGIRVKKIDKLKTSYDLKKAQLTDRLQLEDSIIGKAITLYNAERTNSRQAVNDQLDYEIALMNANTAQKNAETAATKATTPSGTDTQTVQLSDGSDILINKATGETIKKLGGSTPASAGKGSDGAPLPKLSNTQVNTGSTNLGVTSTAFKALPGQVQTWALSSGATTFAKAVQDMKQQKAKYDDILSSINASIQPAVVKDYMTKILDQNAPQESKSGGGIWDKIVGFLN